MDTAATAFIVTVAVVFLVAMIWFIGSALFTGFRVVARALDKRWKNKGPPAL